MFKSYGNNRTRRSKKIKNSLFIRCSSLRKVVLCEGIEEVCSSAFVHCPVLETIEWPGTLRSIDNRICDEVRIKPFSDTMLKRRIQEDHFIIGDGILVEYMGCAERVIIPQNVRIIADGAFKNNTYIRTVVAFEGLISIGEYAFSGCSSLMDIHLSKRLEYIGNGAFESCSSLSSVIIPGEIKSIAYQVFENCTSLYKAELGEGIEEIEWSAFNGCSSLQQIRLPDGLKKYVVMLLVIVRP